MVKHAQIICRQSENMITCKRSYDESDKKFTSTLNNHAPKKKKMIRQNQKPHLNKILSMRLWTMRLWKGTKLKNITNKTKTYLT